MVAFVFLVSLAAEQRHYCLHLWLPVFRELLKDLKVFCIYPQLPYVSVLGLREDCTGYVEQNGGVSGKCQDLLHG